MQILLLSTLMEKVMVDWAIKSRQNICLYLFVSWSHTFVHPLFISWRKHCSSLPCLPEATVLPLVHFTLSAGIQDCLVPSLLILTHSDSFIAFVGNHIY